MSFRQIFLTVLTFSHLAFSLELAAMERNNGQSIKPIPDLHTLMLMGGTLGTALNLLLQNINAGGENSDSAIQGIVDLSRNLPPLPEDMCGNSCPSDIVGMLTVPCRGRVKEDSAFKYYIGHAKKERKSCKVSDLDKLGSSKDDDSDDNVEPKNSNPESMEDGECACSYGEDF